MLFHPSFVNKDSDGLYYAIDQAGARIVIFSKDGAVKRCLYAGAGSGVQFTNAAGVCADSKYIYILSLVRTPDGNSIEREDVIRCTSSGVPDKIIYSRKYEEDDRPRHNGRISGLKISAGKVNFFYKYNDGIDLVTADPVNGAASSVTLVSGKAMGLLIQSIYSGEDGVVYLTKKGEIISVKNKQRPVTVYSGKWGDKGERSYPWNLAVIEEDSIIFCNLEKKALVRIDGSDINEWVTAADLEKLDIKSAETAIVNSMVLDDGSALLIAGDSIISREAGAYDIYGPVLKTGMPLLLKCYALWAAAVMCVICVVMLLGNFYINANAGLRIMFRFTMAGIIFIASAAGTSAWYMQKRYSAVIEKESAAALNTLLGLVPSQINGDTVSGIADPSNFMDDNYMSALDGLRTVMDYNNRNTSSQYTGRITRTGDGWKYLVIDADDSGGISMPLSFQANAGYPSGTMYGRVTFQDSPESYGWHVSGGSPVKDSSGKTVAWLEIRRSLNDYIKYRTDTYINTGKIAGAAMLLLLLVNSLFYFVLLKPAKPAAGSKPVN